MYTIKDYVKWWGELDWKQEPLKTEDIVVLSSLMYCPYEELLGKDYKGKTLGELNELVYINRKPTNDWGWQVSLFETWLDLPNYRRFANVKLANFEAVTDSDEQFAAATYEVGDCVVVAFRGTDTTMIGWKEDIDIAYQGTLPSQQTALKYLNHELQKYDKLYITGHSKGGNLAMYSAAYCDTPVKIVKVFNLDGPGLCYDAYRDKWALIKDKLVTLVPYGSIIGVILGYGANYAVVSSTARGFNQHDTFTWEFDGPHLNYVGELSDRSRKLSETFHEFMNKTKDEDRKVLINTLFKLADILEVDDVDDLLSNLLPSAPNMIKMMHNLDPQEKKILRELGKTFVRSGIHTITS